MEGIFGPSKRRIAEHRKERHEDFDKLFDELEEAYYKVVTRVFLLGVLGGLCGGIIVTGLYILFFN